MKGHYYHLLYSYLDDITNHFNFSQEAFIRKILSKPFKVPIPNYTGQSVLITHLH